MVGQRFGEERREGLKKPAFGPSRYLLSLIALALMLALTACGRDEGGTVLDLSPTATLRLTSTAVATPSPNSPAPTPRPPTIDSALPRTATPPPSTGRAIPFQPLAQGYGLLGNPTQATVLLATDNTDLEAVAALLDPRHRDLLRQVDLQAQALLAAFSGVRPSGGFSISITDVAEHDGGITVTVDLDEVGPEVGRVAAETIPYHVVAISREHLQRVLGLSYRLVSEGDVLAAGELR